jgi:hypothetical protein
VTREFAVSEKQVASVEELASVMRSRNPLSAAEIDLLRKQRLPNYLSDNKEQISAKLLRIHSCDNPLSSLTGETEEAREFLRSKDNDLNFHLDTVRKCFAAYLKEGVTPPPSFPYRVAVILRKAGLTALEQSFLEAWVAHFPGDGGGRFAALQERLVALVSSCKKQAESK